MSNSIDEADPSMVARARTHSHPHASLIPQQHPHLSQHHPIEPLSDVQLIAQNRVKRKSATLAAIAALGQQKGAPHSDDTIPLSSPSPIHSGSQVATSPSVSVASPTSVPHPPPIAVRRQIRAAKGTLDQLAAQPIPAAVLEQELRSSPELLHRRSSVTRTELGAFRVLRPSASSTAPVPGPGRPFSDAQVAPGLPAANLHPRSAVPVVPSQPLALSQSQSTGQSQILRSIHPLSLQLPSQNSSQSSSRRPAESDSPAMPKSISSSPKVTDPRLASPSSRSVRKSPTKQTPQSLPRTSQTATPTTPTKSKQLPSQVRPGAQTSSPVPSQSQTSNSMSTHPQVLSPRQKQKTSSLAVDSGNPVRSSSPFKPTPQMATSPTFTPPPPTTQAEASGISHASATTAQRVPNSASPHSIQASSATPPLLTDDATQTVAEQPRAAQMNSEISSSPAPQPSLDPATRQRLRGDFLTSEEQVDFYSLTYRGDGYPPVAKMSCLKYSAEQIEMRIIQEVERDGRPLIISDLHKTAAWDRGLFNAKKFEELFLASSKGSDKIKVRNLMDLTDRTMPLSDYIDHCDLIDNYAHEDEQKLYANDLPCPSQWTQAISKMVHPRLRYQGDQDLAASLPMLGRANTQKCLYGPGQTCTGFYRNICSSAVQDLMVDCDENASSVWFIIPPQKSTVVSKWVEAQGGDPLSNDFTAHPDDLGNSLFPGRIYAAEQVLGDLVLIPPGAYHEVLNIDGRTMRVNWPRMTVGSLQMACQRDLALNQRICRKENVHVKSVIEEALIEYTEKVESDVQDKRETHKRYTKNFRRLLSLYDAIVADEYIPEWRQIPLVGGTDSHVECDFCGADVLHAYFECDEGETLCSLCYCQGRLCSCSNAVETLKPFQHYRNFGQRLQIRNTAAETLLKVYPEDGYKDDEDEDEEPVEYHDEFEVYSDDEDVAYNANKQPELPPPKPVLKEEEVGKEAWPLSFMAAYKLYKIRKTPGWKEDLAPCKMCNAVLDRSQRHFCKQCKHSYCYGCFLHKMFIHPVHVLAHSNSLVFHNYHKGSSKLDYDEWKNDPLEYCAEARLHFELIEAAKIYIKCHPMNPKCQIGFLDVSDEYPRGLSGTLGVKNPKKPLTSKVRKSLANPSSSTSTPDSRKRKSDLIQAPSSASPQVSNAKKVRLSSPSIVDRNDADDDNGVQFLSYEGGQDSEAIPSTGPAASQQSIISIASDTPEPDFILPMDVDDDTTSVPTVASGIRKFVLREGKAHPVSPTLTPRASLQSAAASPSTAIPAVASPVPAKQTLPKPSSYVSPARAPPAIMPATLPAVNVSARTTLSTDLIPLAQAAAATAARSNAPAVAPLAKAQSVPSRMPDPIASSPTKSSAASAAAQTKAASNPPQTSGAAKPIQPISVAPPASAQASAPNLTARPNGTTAPSQKMTSAGSPPATASASSSNNAQVATLAANATAVAIDAIKQDTASNGSIAMATGAATADAAASGAPVPTPSGLASLNRDQLRVTTEVLRIFSQANQQVMQQSHAAITQSIVKMQQEQATSSAVLQQSLAAMTGLVGKVMQEQATTSAMLQQRNQELRDEVVRLSRELIAVKQQHSRELNDVKQQLQESQAPNKEIKEMYEMLRGLMGDIERGAQAEVEAELSLSGS